MWVSSTSRIVARDLVDDVAPQLRGFEHIGLVDRAEFLLAAPRHLEPDARDARDLGLVIAHQVIALAQARRGAAAALLAEIDVAGQLAHDHHVDRAARLGA